MDWLPGLGCFSAWWTNNPCGHCSICWQLLMEFSSSCLHGRAGVPKRLGVDLSINTTAELCISMKWVYFVLRCSVFFLKLWTFLMDLENPLVHFFCSYLISPRAGSVLWLWTALPSVLLSVGPWASGWVPLKPLATLSPQRSFSPPRAGPTCRKRVLGLLWASHRFLPAKTACGVKT